MLLRAADMIFIAVNKTLRRKGKGYGSRLKVVLCQTNCEVTKMISIVEKSTTRSLANATNDLGAILGNGVKFEKCFPIPSFFEGTAIRRFVAC
jgi:hypothetical protein